MQMLRGRGTAAAVSQLQQLLRAAVLATAMGRRSTQPRATQQAGKKKTQKEPTYKKVGLGRRRLAPYPDQEGNALRLGSKGSAAAVLSADNLVKEASERNTDMLRRPGLAVAMAAAAAHHGGKAVVQGIAARALDNLATMLKRPEGQAFLQAAEALKDAKSKGASRAVVRKAVRSHVKYFQSAGTQLQDALVDVAAISASAYLMATHCLEQKALLGAPSKFAKRWRRSGQQPKELAPWLREPGNREALTEGMGDLVLAELATRKKRTNPSDSRGADAAATFSNKTETSETAPASTGAPARRSALKTPTLAQQLARKAAMQKVKSWTEDKARPGDRILVLKEAHLARILAETKTLEVRDKPLRARTVWLGTKGIILGRARIHSATEITTDEEWRALRPQHGVDSQTRPYKRTYGLRVSEVTRVREGQPYRHPVGAIGIVVYREGVPPAATAAVLARWEPERAAAALALSAQWLKTPEKANHSRKAVLAALLEHTPKEVLAKAGLEDSVMRLMRRQQPRQEPLRVLLEQVAEVAARRVAMSSICKQGSSSEERVAEGTVRINIHLIEGVDRSRRADPTGADQTIPVDAPADATVEVVLAQFFETHSSPEERANWIVKVLLDDKTLQSLDPRTARASTHREIALVRKGED